MTDLFALPFLSARNKGLMSWSGASDATSMANCFRKHFIHLHIHVLAEEWLNWLYHMCLETVYLITWRTTLRTQESCVISPQMRVKKLILHNLSVPDPETLMGSPSQWTISVRDVSTGGEAAGVGVSFWKADSDKKRSTDQLL